MYLHSYINHLSSSISTYSTTISPVQAHAAAVSSGAMFQIFAAITVLEFIGIVALKESNTKHMY